MTVIPGYGTERLHLRQSSDWLFDQFGDPTERREIGSFREYWLYPGKRFDCIVSRKSNRLLTLFLYEGNPFGEIAMFGKTEERIRKLYKSHPREGGGFNLSTGDYVGRWLTYDEGIGFDFDAEGKLRTISVFAPKHKSKRKPILASHRRRGEAIAALRVR